ncbi:MAG: hypothetical protein HND27_01160 [Bacteroidetes bacterium]|nr:hypothetical protein [Bacteroidota bacterium]MBV6461329.1 hypothetical protein [Flavobacteriales bacterium]WKZ75271.1 MAG: hypothetical protein QY303_14110 [Vicingaceae bacterium]MCL4816538.1 hypothetical protein [Flavobacteriales bacterium]NOG94366.1 hypothetical protein [Bacteroidota bacterium]
MKNSITQIINPLIFISLLSLIAFSCAKDEGPFVKKMALPLPKPQDTVPSPTDTTPTTIPEPTVFPYTILFNTDVKPIFPANCVQGCHNPQHPKLDLRPNVAYKQLLTDGFSAPYVNVSVPKQSILYLHLVGIYPLMPKNGQKLSQGKIDTIYTWISQGALDN